MDKIKAVVLFSGGLDSTVLLASALEAGRSCLALSFNYGQRHVQELEYAKALAAYYGVEHKIITIEPSYLSGGSALTSSNMPHQQRTAQQIKEGGIPNTYVPARNTLFLAYALGQAEMIQANEIYYGANALDHNPYPDCRQVYFDAFQGLINVATKQAVEGHPPKLIAPFLTLNKVEIIKLGQKLKVPFDKTFSCYSPKDRVACLTCDSCTLRRLAFEEAQA